MMLKPLIIITLLNVIPSCEGQQQYQSPLDVPEIRLEVQANDYALKYTNDLLNGTTVLITKEKYAYEAFSLHENQDVVTHQNFEQSPYQQIYQALKKEPDQVYELAKRHVESNLTVYYYKDCPFLEDTAEYVLNADITDIEQAYTPPETPTITFMYPSKSYNYTDWHTVETDYAGHPLFNIYERLQKDIQKCEHPKFIGIPESLRARK